MTTNVKDEFAKELATDSRWTIDLRKNGKGMVIAQDDAEYQKIIELDSDVFMFAGLCKAIDAWKQALALASYYPEAVNWVALPKDGMALCAVEKATGFFEEFGPIEKTTGASFAGTGAKFAKVFWEKSHDAKSAVEHAMKHDQLTGGTVMYYNYKTGEKNLGIDSTLDKLHNGFRTKGFVMYTETRQTLPIAEAAANDNSLHAVLNQIGSGALIASAPCDPEYAMWSDDEKSKLVAAMERRFNKNRAPQ